MIMMSITEEEHPSALSGYVRGNIDSIAIFILCRKMQYRITSCILSGANEKHLFTQVVMRCVSCLCGNSHSNASLMFCLYRLGQVCCPNIRVRVLP